LLFLFCGALLIWYFPIFAPRLYTSRGVFQFGTTEQGNLVHAQFSVRNLHPWNVTVTNVIGGCGCARAVADRNLPFVLHPGESVLINASIDTAKRKGEISQTIHVLTEKPIQKTPLVITGMVKP
jgi:hypothetical protein